MRSVFLLSLAFILSGCVARTAVNVVTLPVRAVGAGVDAVTTSQSEADERRGRELRREEERRGRLARRCERRPERAECAELDQLYNPPSR
jgi:CRISPR/Cas system-associated protein Csm6